MTYRDIEKKRASERIRSKRYRARKHLERYGPNVRSQSGQNFIISFAADQYCEAEAIWRDLERFPTWAAADVALAQIKTAKGQAFSRDRAVRIWGPRKKRKPTLIFRSESRVS